MFVYVAATSGRGWPLRGHQSAATAGRQQVVPQRSAAALVAECLAAAKGRPPHFGHKCGQAALRRHHVR